MTRDQVLNTPLADGQAAVFYLGQEGFLFRYRNTIIAIDPYLTDYVDRHSARRTVTWKRSYAPPIEPEDLAFADYVILTHGHCDHADPDTLSRLAKAGSNTQFICPAPIGDLLLSYGIEPARLHGASADESMSLGDFSIRPIPAAHEVFHTDSQGRYAELSYILSMGDLHVFHSGDACIYDGLEEKIMDMDVLFLPINGRSAFKNRENIIGNMTAEEAIELAVRTRGRMLIPMHFDLYGSNGLNPAVFVDMISTAAPDIPYHIFKPGERYILCK